MSHAVEKQKSPATRGTVLVLRTVVYVIGAVILIVCAGLLPELAREEAARNPEAVTYPFLIGAYLLTIPVFVALYYVLSLANYIDKDQAFTNDFVRALRNIKYSALIFGGLVVVGALTIVVIAQSDGTGEDGAPIITIGFVLAFASSVVATVADLFQRLFQSAVDIRSENDLTV